jgi:hypothetical protein
MRTCNERYVVPRADACHLAINAGWYPVVYSVIAGAFGAFDLFFERVEVEWSPKSRCRVEY